MLTRVHRTVVLFVLVTLSGTACDRPRASPANAPADTTATPHVGDLGQYRRPITTSSPEAQRLFDQGLNLLYGFNHEAAVAAFGRAAAADDRSPMPHWGMALALGTNINDPAPVDRLQRAYTHLAAAQQRAPNGSAVEQGLVRALAERYVREPSGPQDVREQAYAGAMGALAAQFPQDADVGALYAESMMNLHPWKLYRPDGAPEPWTPAIVEVLERVLRTHATHPGANHYYIHAVEASRTPDRALRSAERLETLVPGAGHLVHMPSHIYIRTGQFTKAARSNAVAAAVDEQYFGGKPPESFYAMGYYGHNLQFESAAAMFAGNFAEARDAARRTVALEDPMADMMVMLELFAAQELLVLTRFGAWRDVLAMQPPKPSRTVQSGLYRWARGAALAATGDAAGAAAQLDSLQRILTRVPKDAFVGPVNRGGDVLKVAAADLTGRLHVARGDLPRAIAAFTAAVAAEDRLGYNEPPDWLFPERERLGVALLMAGRAAEAERVFRADLIPHVGNGRALLGVALSLEAQHKTAEAAAARRTFAEAWRGADVTLGDDLYPRVMSGTP